MQRRWVSAIGLIGTVMLGNGIARGADDPLLVVVEAQPGLGIDAAAVRRRIATELGRSVVSPRDRTATGASNVLIVALDDDEIRISFREGATTRVSRAIPDAPEPATRLRAIAWLAGNLARDQVGAILPQLALAQTDAAAAPVPVPKAAPPAATEPPALTAAPPSTPPDATLAVSGRDARTANGVSVAHWAVTAVGGMAISEPCPRESLFAGTCGPLKLSSFLSSNYQLELQHQSTPEAMILGGAFETGSEWFLAGIAGFAGLRRSWRGLFLEGTLGVGIAAEEVNALTHVVTSSSVTGVSSETSVTNAVQPALYARAVGSIGLPINQSFDVIARLGIHAFSSGLTDNFLSANVGVRLRLQ